MEFLVNITLRWSENMDPDLKERIIKEERAHAGELAKQGHLVRMWRVPGRFQNWGLWRARNATELHEVISSLPAFPWMINVDVHPLAKHAVDPTPYEA